jgi:carboxypeptidase C (cathepsin A)
MNTSRTILSALLALGIASGIAPVLHAQEHKPDAPEAADKKKELPIPAEAKVETKHEWTAGSRPVHYTATAGTLYVNDEHDKAIGTMFYVAYTEDGAPAKSRPVTFLYNGGPGSASIWLHMGSVGPVRVETASPKSTPGAPYAVVPNEYSLLDKTDLVFVDAPLTGFSRIVGAGTPKDFVGVDEDVKAFTKFVTRYITLNQRWNSPKFLFGESYGTPRSAALVASLYDEGIQCNGVVLLSSILNYYVRASGYDLEPKTYLPSYAAIAWYFNKVPHTGTMEEFVEKAREFARGPYAEALDEGNTLAPAKFDAIAKQVAAFTGLSEQFVKEAKLRISPSRFRKELLRDQEQILGRFDARFEGPDADAAGEYPSYDPSDTGISGAYVATFHNYLQTELKYTSADTYFLHGPGTEKWNWEHHPAGGRSQREPNTVLDLADTLRKNPALKIFSANGWFDLATPFFGTEHDLAQLQVPAASTANVKFTYYPAGHMVYLNVAALKQFHADLEAWYPTAIAK